MNGDLTVTSGSLDISSNTVTVSGETDIKGTLMISTGSYKGGGGAISFTDAGFLKCAASVYSLGSMNSNIGTVVFDKTSNCTTRYLL